jgi:replication factor A1
MPIRILNQFTSDWKIKARVVKKAAVKSWTNARGSGQLLNFDLVDKEGTMIQGTAFNDQATFLDGLLELDGIFTFSGGYVKLANKRFTSIKNDYCLTFSQNSIVERC